MKNLKARKPAAVCVAMFMALTAVNASANPEHADDDDRGIVKNYPQENKGVAGGAIFGGIVGGPPGIFLGAFAGGLIGRHQGLEKDLEQKNRTILTLQAAIDRQKAMIAKQEQVPANDVIQLASLNQVRVIESRDLQQILQDGFEITIQFRTGSDHLEPHFDQAILRAAKVIRQLDGVQVHLTGFADPRGTVAQNDLLASRRIEAVKRIFLEEGLEQDRIHVHVKGERESLGLGEDSESLSFDRRVVIQFSKEGYAS
jgi:outer membrane protein OmpA-like peptidoglycan-associated protein